MTTYTWKIESMSVLQHIGETSDYVIDATWSLTGNTEVSGTNYEGIKYGTTSFTVDPSKPDFTPYDELTESQVINWVQATLGTEGVAEAETFVDNIIASQQLPKPIYPPLPWADSSVASVVAE